MSTRRPFVEIDDPVEFLDTLDVAYGRREFWNRLPHYATFLASQNRNKEARQWAERILAKKPTMPRYLQRRERPWFRKASALLKRLPAVG